MGLGEAQRRFLDLEVHQGQLRAYQDGQQLDLPHLGHTLNGERWGLVLFGTLNTEPLAQKGVCSLQKRGSFGLLETTPNSCVAQSWGTLDSAPPNDCLYSSGQVAPNPFPFVREYGLICSFCKQIIIVIDAVCIHVYSQYRRNASSPCVWQDSYLPL